MPRTWPVVAPGLAKRRSRRMRKKLKIGEFQQLGFVVRSDLARDMSADAQIDLTERLIVEVLAPRDLQMGGSLQEAYVAKRSPRSATDADRAAVIDWLGSQLDIGRLDVGPLVDAWYGDTD